MTEGIAHPYIPNSISAVKEGMLSEIGTTDVNELFRDIPQELIMKKKLALPGPKSECEVRRLMMAMLTKNRTREEIPSFLGAGCWPHYVPAVCDEIIGRAEFLTAYAGDTYCDLGRFQAIFEFQSMMSELVGLDAVAWPMYDWATICGEAARMASRVTGRHQIMVPRIISPDRLSVMRNYCERLIDIKPIDYDPETGQLDIDDLMGKISFRTAGVYVENPSYVGLIESEGDEISKIAHDYGALSIVGVEPTSLGILTPPGEYGADIVIGDVQPLGNHMNYGGGVAGIIACRDDERLVGEMPAFLCTIATTECEGEYGFSWWTLPERLHFFSREKGRSFAGTSTTLWGIAAAVYMALLGPEGMRELGEAVMQKSHYAMKQISEIAGTKVPIFDSAHFEEFTVDFQRTGKTVQDINSALLNRGIQGGKDITLEFPELGHAALYCVTETHTKEEIDRLVAALQEVAR
jgi:glycine dehydrogenase subunit 1